MASACLHGDGGFVSHARLKFKCKNIWPGDIFQPVSAVVTRYQGARFPQPSARFRTIIFFRPDASRSTPRNVIDESVIKSARPRPKAGNFARRSAMSEINVRRDGRFNFEFLLAAPLSLFLMDDSPIKCAIRAAAAAAAADRKRLFDSYLQQKGNEHFNQTVVGRDKNRARLALAFRKRFLSFCPSRPSNPKPPLFIAPGDKSYK